MTKTKKLLNSYERMLLFVNNTNDTNYKNRSSHKVNIIHTNIAYDIGDVLGDSYSVRTDYIDKKNVKEAKIQGRYYEKKVDITIWKDGRCLAGIAFKNPLNSFAKNKNNYFENILGDTANIRGVGILYYQIMILPHKIPDWQEVNNEKVLKKWDVIDKNSLKSIINLGLNDPKIVQHAPNKTLIMVFRDSVNDTFISGKKLDYSKLYIEKIKSKKLNLIKHNMAITKEEKKIWSRGLLINEYTKFIQKICYEVKKQNR